MFLRGFVHGILQSQAKITERHGKNAQKASIQASICLPTMHAYVFMCTFAILFVYFKQFITYLCGAQYVLFHFHRIRRSTCGIYLLLTDKWEQNTISFNSMRTLYACMRWFTELVAAICMFLVRGGMCVGERRENHYRLLMQNKEHQID